MLCVVVLISTNACLGEPQNLFVLDQPTHPFTHLFSHSFTTFIEMKCLSLIAALAVSGLSAAQPYDVQSQASKREANGSFIPATAPYENIFADITSKEETSVLKFLQKQINETL